jgi:hypothetical protein
LTLCQEAFVASKNGAIAVINKFSVAGNAPGDASIAEALGVSTTKYKMPSRMITAAEPISIHESAIVEKLAG